MPAEKTKTTILNVDDNDIARYATSRILTKEGFTVIEASTGNEALERVQEIPDLVLLDVNLPDIGGFEVCRIIKGDPHTSLIPVLHLSATYKDDSSKVKGLETGADGYLTYPIDPSLLIAYVRSLLRIGHTEKRLQNTAQQWSSAFDAMEEAICLMDTESKFLQCNTSMKKLVDKSSNEIHGRPCWEVLYGTSKPVEGCPFTRMKETLQRETHEMLLGERWFEIIVDPLTDIDGILIGAVHMMSDITDRKKEEQNLKTSLKEKGLLLQEIHHRVKLNMQVMSNLFKLQAETTQDDSLKDAVRDSLRRMISMSLVHEKLSQTDDFTHVPFKDYLSSLISYLSQFYESKTRNVELVTEIDEILLTITHAVPCGLIVNELVSNALMHAFPDKKTGTISVAFHSSEKNGIVLSVSDTGIGLPKAIDIKTTENLGLRLVRILVKDHLKGKITLDRSEGTKFLIEFKTQ